jgi:hypothetical protein
VFSFTVVLLKLVLPDFSSFNRGRLTDWWAAASVIVIRLKSQLLKASCHSSEVFPLSRPRAGVGFTEVAMDLPKQAFPDKLGAVVELFLSQRL